MAEQVELPAVGKVKREYVFAGVAVVAAIVGYAYYRRRSNATASVPVADPTTGSTTGGNTYSNPDPQYTDTGNSADKPPTTNEAWASRVMDKMSWLEPAYLSDVLGKYLGRQSLSVTEAAIVRSAWAIVGHPPQDVPLILSTGGGTPGSSSTSTRDVRVAEGSRVADVLSQYGVTFEELSAANGGLTWPRIADANENGYLSQTNQGGTVVKVFPSTQTIKVPIK